MSIGGGFVGVCCLHLRGQRSVEHGVVSQNNFEFLISSPTAKPVFSFLTFYWPLVCKFNVHVTIHGVKILTMKSTRCTNFSNLFLEWNSTCFGQFLCPSSGVFHCTHGNGICHTADSLRAGSGWNCSYILILLASCQQTCMTYTIAVCTVKNSWWRTEELSETCRVSFQE